MLGFIPMNDTVKISKGETVDEWGVATASGSSPDIKARVSYNTSRETLSLSSGEEIVFTATIFIEGLPHVDYESFIEWQDDFGAQHSSEPLDIQYKKDFAGNPVLLRVLV